MSLLKKFTTYSVFSVAVITSSLWSTQTTAEFPNVQNQPALQTPGFQGVITAFENYVEIPLANDGDEFTWIQVPGTQNDLYFPMDGRQPTTREAATWSCANVDNALTSPITEWYMQMFGWQRRTMPGVPAVNLLTMGKASIHTTPRALHRQPDKAIFSLSPLSDQGASRFMHSRTGLKMSRRAIFWDAFRHIASNPVGRVLLYRLLIEIRREDPNQHGSLEPTITGNGVNMIIQRDNCRSIMIRFSDESYFDPNNECINLKDNPSDPITILCINEADKLTTDLADDPLHVTLFHEMLHWFLFLRNPRREYREASPAVVPSRHNYIFRAYYGNATVPEEWQDEPGTISCSEIRTILGSPVAPGRAGANLPPVEWQFCEGDDLSENAYRASWGLYMRWGHVNSDVIPQDFAVPAVAPMPPRHFIDAHHVASACYNQITGNIHWDFIPGQAIGTRD